MTALQEAAMRKALEALETCSYGDYSAKHVVDPSFDGDAVEAAIESLKAALAQQGEQAKPVAYITDTHQGPMVWTPEMYGEACIYCDDDEFPVPLYTQPAQMRILTDEQIKSMWAQYCSYPGGILDFARAIRDVK